MSFMFKKQPKPTPNLPNGFFNEIRSYDMSKRLAECVKMRQKFPDKIPVIVDRGDTKTPAIDKHKYLVPSSHTLMDFQAILRSKIKLDPSQALFCFIGQEGVLGQSNRDFATLYEQYKSEDNYLYITYMLESTFG